MSLGVSVFMNTVTITIMNTMYTHCPLCRDEGIHIHVMLGMSFTSALQYNGISPCTRGVVSGHGHNITVVCCPVLRSI